MSNLIQAAIRQGRAVGVHDRKAEAGERFRCEVIDRVATGSADTKTIMDYMKGPSFAVAAYKGQKLTLRDWDWQLRQPILLSDGRNTVSISPQPGFLHQVTELDTLGYDRPETQCKLK